MKPSDRPINIPRKLWDAKMRIEGYWSEWNEPDIEGALERIIEYLIEEKQRNE